MPLKTWSSGDVVNAAELNTTIEDAIKGVTYDLDAGETIDGTSDPVAGSINPDDGEVYKSDASDRDYLATNHIGFVLNSTTNGNEARLQTSGVVEFTSTFTLDVASSRQDQRCPATTGSSMYQLDSTTKRQSMAFRSGEKQGTVSQIDVYMLKSSPSGIDAQMDIFAMAADGKPTGSSLGSSDTLSITGASSAESFVFSTPVDIDPDTEYCFVISLTSYTSGWCALGGRTSIGYTWIEEPATIQYQSSDSGSTWSAYGGGAGQASFTITTSVNQHSIGDDVFLSETAGELVLDPPDITTALVVKVGKLLANNLVLIDKESGRFLGETDVIDVTGGGTLSTRANAFYHAPKHANTCVIIFEDTFDYEITLHKGESQTYQNNSGNSYDFSWTNGVVEIDTQTYNENIKAKVRFYT